MDARARFTSPFRRRYLVNKRLQLTIVGYFVLLFVVSLTPVYIGITRTLKVINDQAIRLDPHHSALNNVLNEQRSTLVNEFFLIYALVFVLAASLGGILLSHRFAGPLYRLRAILTDLADGKDPARIDFRKKDMLRELIPLLKSVAKRVNKDGDGSSGPGRD